MPTEQYTYLTIQDWVTGFGTVASDSLHSPEAPQISNNVAAASHPEPSSSVGNSVSTAGIESVQATEQVVGFFDLPREVRDQVYFHVIRPDCRLEFPDHCGVHHDCIKNGNDTTKILRLNSQAYLEGNAVLQAHENCIRLTGSRPTVFRNMKAFGKPGKFVSSKKGYRAIVPPRYCDLQFLKFSGVAICVEVPFGETLQGNYHGVLEETCKNLSRQIACVTSAIDKSQTLRNLRVLISRSDYNTSRLGYQYINERREAADVNDPLSASQEKRSHAIMQSILRPLIVKARAKGIRVGAEEETLFHGRDVWGARVLAVTDPIEDPLVVWVNSIVPENERMVLDLPYRMNMDEDVFDESTGIWHIQLPFAVNHWRSGKKTYPDRCMPEEHLRFVRILKATRATGEPYQLVPECRTCYAVFSTWQDLKAHLETQPKHKTSYRAKAYNEIYPDAVYDGFVKCNTCAKIPPSETIGGLEMHYRNNPWHRRHSMVQDGRRTISGGIVMCQCIQRFTFTSPWTEKQLRLREIANKGKPGNVEEIAKERAYLAKCASSEAPEL